jgi:hypothetical protein
MQGSGLTGIDRLAGNFMYPQSQMEKTQYSVSSQMPTSAEVVNSGYEPKTNSYTGLPMANFAKGGIASFADGGDIDYNARANQLANEVYSMYSKNQNYDERLNELNAIVDKDPAAFYNARIGLLGKQMGWQVGQNTGDRNTVYQKELESLIPGAKAAGLTDEQIGNLVTGGSSMANAENQNRIAEEGRKGKGWVNQNVPGGWTTVAALAAAAAAPYALPAMGIGGGAGAGALTTTELLAGAGGAFVPTVGSGASFLLPAGAAYTTAAGAGAAGAGALGGGAGAGAGAGSAGLPTLKEAYNAYKMASTGANILNSLSGNNQTGYGLNPGVAMGSGYNAFDPGVRVTGLPELSSSYEKTPWVDLLPEITLSKLSDFAPEREMASGGIANLGGYSDGGRLLKGPGDGMSDNIPASIGNKQPAKLADGEFVIPADVVSHLGNGSTDAGAKQLYAMMDNIRKARTGNKQQGKQINPNKFLPKG